MAVLLNMGASRELASPAYNQGVRAVRTMSNVLGAHGSTTLLSISCPKLHLLVLPSASVILLIH